MTYRSVFEFNLFLAFSVAYLYLMLAIPNNLLWDRDNYLIYAENSSVLIDSFDGVFDYISGDYLFLLINKFLYLFFSIKMVVNILVSFVIISYLFFIYYKAENFLSFVVGVVSSILILPILHFQLVTIRQAIATTIFIYGLIFLKSKRNLLFLLVFCSLIHSVYYILTIFFFLNFFIVNHFGNKLRYFIIFSVASFFSLTYLIVADYFGFRQAESYSSYSGSVSGGAFFLWAIVLAYLLKYGFEKKSYLYHYCVMGLIVYLVFYFLANVTVAARISESVLPAVLIFLVARLRVNESILILFVSLCYLYLWFRGQMYPLMFEADEMIVKNYFYYIFY